MVLATLLSRVDEFRGLALTMVPSSVLSAQALSILRQLVGSGSSCFFRVKHFRGDLLQLDRGGQIQLDELRFLDDDLRKLVSVGVVTLDNNRSGGEIYRITRDAVRLLEAVDRTTPKGA